MNNVDLSVPPNCAGHTRTPPSLHSRSFAFICGQIFQP
jgi:hypothetical protein